MTTRSASMPMAHGLLKQETQQMPNGLPPRQPHILVVDPLGPRRDTVVSTLKNHGYSVVSAGGFDDARRVLDQGPLDLLITELRLGPYNGLHLVLSGQGRSPGMSAIVTGQDSDSGLAAETYRCGASYLASPPSEHDLLESVRHALKSDTPQG